MFSNIVFNTCSNAIRNGKEVILANDIVLGVPYSTKNPIGLVLFQFGDSWNFGESTWRILKNTPLEGKVELVFIDEFFDTVTETTIAKQYHLVPRTNMLLNEFVEIVQNLTEEYPAYNTPSDAICKRYSKDLSKSNYPNDDEYVHIVIDALTRISIVNTDYVVKDDDLNVSDRILAFLYAHMMRTNGLHLDHFIGNMWFVRLALYALNETCIIGMNYSAKTLSYVSNIKRILKAAYKDLSKDNLSFSNCSYNCAEYYKRML